MSLKTGTHLLHISVQLDTFQVLNRLMYLVSTLECTGLVPLLKVR